MQNPTNISELFDKLKNCADSATFQWFDPISVAFPLLSGDDKMALSKDLYDWAIIQAPGSLKIPVALYLCGLANHFTEHYETSLNKFTDAQKLFEDLHNADGVAICMAGMGSVYRTLGSPDLAIKTLWEAYDTLKKSGVAPYSTVVASFQIASIFVEKKNYEEALNLFEAILKIAEQNAYWAFMLSARQGIAKIHIAVRNYDLAKQAYENALKDSEQLGSPMIIANTQTEIANYYFITGDYEEAEKYNDLALANRQQQNLAGASITNLLQLAEIYVRQNKTDAAITMLQKGLELAERIKVMPKISQLHKKLADIYEANKDAEKSLYHYKCFHEVQEQLEHEDAAKKIKNLRLMFEAEQTKKENIIIKQQKAEIEEKNIELQDTIDALTLAKVSKKAKALTLTVAVLLFVIVDLILELVLHLLPEDNILLTFTTKIIVVFSMKPVEAGIEHYMLKKIVLRRKMALA